MADSSPSTTDRAPAPDVPSNWTRVDPFPRIHTNRSFVSETLDTDRIRVMYFRAGEEPVLRGKVWFGPATEGPPGIAHGGAVAAALDESVGGVAWMLGYRVVVARLTVDFRTMVRIGTDATLEASVAGVDGRKVTCRARLTDGETLLAEAEALCVVLKEP
jgi:acyl-coenzyme A thioesterase PaaI-like protein